MTATITHFGNYLVLVCGLIYDSSGCLVVVDLVGAALVGLPREVTAKTMSLPLSNALGLSAVILKAARGYCIIPEIEKQYADELILSTKEFKR